MKFPSTSEPINLDDLGIKLNANGEKPSVLQVVEQLQRRKERETISQRKEPRAMVIESR